MTPLDPVLESALTGARRRFQVFRFLRHFAFLGFAVVGAVLAVGVAAWLGWLRSTTVTVGIFAALFGLVVLAVPALLIVALVSRRSREWSTNEVEEANPSLLDRLHTLVYLQKSPPAPQGAKQKSPPAPQGAKQKSPPTSQGAKQGGGPEAADPVLASYGRRIERQAMREMVLAVRPLEAEKRQVVRLWLLGFLSLLLTVLFFLRFEPFSALGASTWDGPANAGAEEAFLEEPAADAAELKAEEEEPAWGEVRITEPARDLKVTKVDVVPLQIEAATSHPIRTARWVTARTGEEPRHRELPPPEEPRFAVYQPLLYVDELRLADWDVVTYYAGASTARDEYASDVYFLEVRPFREEIEKLMGGAGNQGGAWMSQITGLIDRQKHILRQTHRFLARPARVSSSDQDQEKLVAAEDDLAEAVRHLYAQMAAEGENRSIGDVLDHLAAAEEELDRATAALAEDPRTAPPPEQSALAELVATRKSLQRAISDNPEAFGGEESEDEPFPVAELSDKLEQISEFRDEEKAALELLDEMLEEERRIGGEIEDDPRPGRMSELASRQAEARQQLDQFETDHPRLFEKAREEARRAGEAMRALQEALEQGDPDLAGERQGVAVAAVEELRETVEGETLSRQLRDAYQLERLLEEQAQRMGEMASRPGDFSGEQASQAAGAAKETTRELKEIMEESAVGQGFGPELHQALSDARQEELEADLDEVAGAEDEASRAGAAAEAQKGLEAVSDAFEKSAPQLLRELREEDALAPDDAEALENALRQLRGLLARRGNPPDNEDEARREALLNLRQGLEGLDGSRRRTEALLEEAEEALENEEEVDADRLRRLLEQLERFRAELGGIEVEELELDLAHIEASKLPAEYRERIQNYFRKLSEGR